MLAQKIPSLLPDPANQEILEINMIASIMGKIKSTVQIKRPFRNPHHSCSMAPVIVGGGHLHQAKRGHIST